MAQTNPTDAEVLDEKPQAMLFDGWGYVPLPERDLRAPPPKAEPKVPTPAV